MTCIELSTGVHTAQEQRQILLSCQCERTVTLGVKYRSTIFWIFYLLTLYWNDQKHGGGIGHTRTTSETED